MALITDLTTSWTAGETLTKKTLFQCRAGVVRVETGASAPDADDGAVLDAGDAVELEAGVTVYWRLHNNTASTIARVELEP